MDSLHLLSKDLVKNVVELLQTIGVESFSDLQFVEEVDLLLVIKPIQARKLIKSWRNASEIEITSDSTEPVSIESQLLTTSPTHSKEQDCYEDHSID